MAQPAPANKRSDTPPPARPDKPPDESVAGEEDPGAALGADGEPSENDPARRPAPATPRR